MAYYNPYFGNYSNYNQNYQQTQNGLVPIPSEDMARVYPVAHGASVTFRDENRPYIYIKTLGLGQLDSPMFEKYRLVKEDTQKVETAPAIERAEDLPAYVTKSEFGALRDEFEALRGEIDGLRKEIDHE